MSTLILIAAGGSLGGVVGAAAMFIPAKLLRDDAHTFMERGEETFDKAEKLAATVDQTRNRPWFWEPEPHVTGELVAVTDTPALSAESHEDEQAADEDDDRQGVGAWLLATLIRLCEDAYDRITEAWQSWRTRDEVGNGESVTYDEESLRTAGATDEELSGLRNEVAQARSIGSKVHAIRKVVDAHPLTDEDIAAEIAELTGEPVKVEVAEIREVDGRKQVRAAHWNDGTAVHSTVYVGRRRKVGA